MQITERETTQLTRAPLDLHTSITFRRSREIVLDQLLAQQGGSRYSIYNKAFVDESRLSWDTLFFLVAFTRFQSERGTDCTQRCIYMRRVACERVAPEFLNIFFFPLPSARPQLSPASVRALLTRPR